MTLGAAALTGSFSSPSGGGEGRRDTSALNASIYLRRGAFSLDVTLGAPAGMTALLGPSGAGKSLTLQAIAGLTPVTSGWMTLNGRTLMDTAASVNLPSRLRRVGYVPQSYALFPHLSVASNIAYGLPRGLDRAARGRRIADLLALGRLPGYEARRPRDLSGGEAQRVAVLRALAARPEALLLDEPFSALDAPTRMAVRDDLGALIADSGLPAILVTHDLGEALSLAGRLALLVDGRVVVAGEAAEAVATPPTLRAARLLGWSAALEVAGYEAVGEGAARVTLACDQRLTLDAPAIAPGIMGKVGARVALAVRPERLLIARADTESDVARDALRGMMGEAGAAGATGRALAEVALEGGGEPLRLALTPREWAALGLAPGQRVTLRPLPGALRLVAREGA